MNTSLAEVADVPFGVVTVIVAAPGPAGAGLVTVNDVALSAVNCVLVIVLPPNVTDVAVFKLSPWIVTDVLTRRLPECGLMDVTVGAVATAPAAPSMPTAPTAIPPISARAEAVRTTFLRNKDAPTGALSSCSFTRISFSRRCPMCSRSRLDVEILLAVT